MKRVFGNADVASNLIFLSMKQPIRVNIKNKTVPIRTCILKSFCMLFEIKTGINVIILRKSKIKRHVSCFNFKE